MGRFTIAAAFFLAAMMAISRAHAGRTLKEGERPPYAAGGTLVGNGANWPSGLELRGRVFREAGGPAAADAADGVAFVHGKIGDHSINYYEKIPIFGP